MLRRGVNATMWHGGMLKDPLKHPTTLHLSVPTQTLGQQARPDSRGLPPPLKIPSWIPRRRPGAALVGDEHVDHAARGAGRVPSRVPTHQSIRVGPSSGGTAPRQSAGGQSLGGRPPHWRSGRKPYQLMLGM